MQQLETVVIFFRFRKNPTIADKRMQGREAISSILRHNQQCLFKMLNDVY